MDSGKEENPFRRHLWEDLADSFSEPMVLPLWKSLYSLNLMLPKEDRQ